MDLEQIEKLNELKEKGLITEVEYQEAKARILGQPSTQPVQYVSNNRDFAMLIHLAQFCSWLFPFLGMVVPLVMWQTRKEDPYIDQQGKVVMNWVFSSFIYAIVSLLLCFIVIGVPLLIALIICSIVFTIMGAIDATKGIVKNYPLTIKFFAVEETPRTPSAQN